MILATREVAKEGSILLRKPKIRHACCAILLPPSSTCTRCLSCNSYGHILCSLAYRMEKTDRAVDRRAVMSITVLNTPD